MKKSILRKILFVALIVIAISFPSVSVVRAQCAPNSSQCPAELCGGTSGFVDSDGVCYTSASCTNSNMCTGVVTGGVCNPSNDCASSCGGSQGYADSEGSCYTSSACNNYTRCSGGTNTGGGNAGSGNNTGGLGIGGGGNAGSDMQLQNPLGVSSINGLINRIIDILIILGIPIASGMIIWAAFLFMTSGGEPDKLTTARHAILWTVIGFVILLIAKGIASIIRSVMGI
ncbi:MAG: pilin [Candidatus Jorgensenbacteria bacterium]|nr:pilin [Candidatus Jorgensenbacteria bacterium]